MHVCDHTDIIIILVYLTAHQHFRSYSAKIIQISTCDIKLATMLKEVRVTGISVQKLPIYIIKMKSYNALLLPRLIWGYIDELNIPLKFVKKG